MNLPYAQGGTNFSILTKCLEFWGKCLSVTDILAHPVVKREQMKLNESISGFINHVDMKC